MARVKLIMPKMGESVSEATIITWSKEIGENVEIDDTIIEIATDKVDSEVPSTHEGKLIEKLFEADDVVQVGEAFAILEIDGDEETNSNNIEIPKEDSTNSIEEVKKPIKDINNLNNQEKTIENKIENTNRFYSPLVKNIAAKEGIKIDELEKITGTGKEGRVTKEDMISYINNKQNPAKNEEKNIRETESIEEINNNNNNNNNTTLNIN